MGNWWGWILDPERTGLLSTIGVSDSLASEIETLPSLSGIWYSAFVFVARRKSFHITKVNLEGNGIPGSFSNYWVMVRGKNSSGSSDNYEGQSRRQRLLGPTDNYAGNARRQWKPGSSDNYDCRSRRHRRTGVSLQLQYESDIFATCNKTLSASSVNLPEFTKVALESSVSWTMMLDLSAGRAVSMDSLASWNAWICLSTLLTMIWKIFVSSLTPYCLANDSSWVFLNILRYGRFYNCSAHGPHFGWKTRS